KEKLCSLNGDVNERIVKRELEEIETLHIKLDHKVTKLAAENEHLKQTYKQLYDSIKSSRVRSKEQCDDLINKVNLKSAEVSDLNASLQEKVLVITALKEQLNKLKSKAVVQIVLWYLDSGCSKHMFGDRSQLVNFVQKFLSTVKFGNDHVAKIMGYGDHQIGNVIISRVYYVEGLGHNLFSIRQFCDSDLEVDFCQHTCFIRNLDGASKTKSWLWHRRLSHLNFGAINHLARQGLVRGLLKLKFEKDHLCSACEMGKSTKKTHKPKSEDTNQEKLYLLHMDLYGPMCVESVNGKKYILIIVDDYSQFTWVKFLRSKDETSAFIIKFLKMIQVRLKVPVRRIRTDNGTEIVNQTLRDYYEEVDISHETLVARSSQQNGVVERRNRTLVEAARTILGPALNEITPGTISFGLVQKSSPSTSYVPPSRNDWDLLFQAMFDELLNPRPSVVNQAPEVIAPIAEDAPSPSKSHTTTEIQSLVIPQDVGDDNLDMEVAHIGNDPLFGVSIPEVTSMQSSSTTSPQSIVQTNHPIPHHNRKMSMFLNRTGFVDPDNPNHLYKLKKAFYGLKQAPRAWYAMLSSFLLSQDFSKGSVDPTLFIRRNGTELLLVQIYVDDMIFAASTLELLDTPMVEKSKLDKDKKGKAVDPSHYHGMIGTLLYLTASRPDLQFAICMCARYQARPTEKLIHAVKRIFQYLRGTVHRGLWYPKDSSVALTACCVY
nr:retrovirus-related Pol polyprotein from transposon TNT 1-94 [Tanacetum cinerariifolium]